jgi:hypothetical protein
VDELKQTTIDNQIEKSATLSMLIADKKSHHQTNAKFSSEKDHKKTAITQIPLPRAPHFSQKNLANRRKPAFFPAPSQDRTAITAALNRTKL